MKEGLTIRKISFRERPITLPADYRPLYKIAMLTMVLKLCCRSERATLLKLHLFSWCLTSEKRMHQLAAYVHRNYTGDSIVWGIEPAVNRALVIANAEGICLHEERGTYVLAERGKAFYDLIAADNELFSLEKDFLRSMGKNKITDARIEAMSNQWSIENAEN